MSLMLGASGPMATLLRVPPAVIPKAKYSSGSSASQVKVREKSPPPSSITIISNAAFAAEDRPRTSVNTNSFFIFISFSKKQLKNL